MKLSDTDKNAVRFIFFLNAVLIGLGFGASVVLPEYSILKPDPVSGAILYGAVFGFFGAFLTLVIPEFYEMTMSGSNQILKSSLVIALVISFAYARYSSGTLAILSIVFLISPVIYDFSRGIIFPEASRDIPWEERRTGMKILEIIIEATMSAVIGIVITYALTGHL